MTFNLSPAFDNVPDKKLTLSTPFSLVNTPNSDDPIASADYVTIGNYGYTFNVVEGSTVSVDLYGKLSTGLSLTPTGASTNAGIEPGPFDPSPITC